MYDPNRLARAIGQLLVLPPEVDVRHISAPKVTVAERLAHLRKLLRRGSFNFDEAVKDADRVTVAVTLFSLLELYKQGELTWSQEQPFGEIRGATSRPSRGDCWSRPHEPDARRHARGAAVPFAGPGHRRRAGRGRRGGARGDRGRRWKRSAGDSSRTAAGLCSGSSQAAGRCRSHPEAEEAARRLLARPRTPPLTPAQAETLAIIAYLQPVSRPEIARIRGVNAESAAATLLERGLVEESGRSQFGAVLYRTTDLFLRLFGLQVDRRAAADQRLRPVA